jgi:hypothetical protein
MPAQTLDLPMPTVEYMIDAVFDTAPNSAKRSPEATRNERDFAAATLIALQPTDAIEAGMAVRIVAAHQAAVDSLRRAALPDIGDATAIRLRANANSLSRMAERLTAALQERQAMERAARQAAAQAAAPSVALVPERAPEDISRNNPTPRGNVPLPPAPKPYRIRLEQLKAEKQAARAARMAAMASADLGGAGALMVG